MGREVSALVEPIHFDADAHRYTVAGRVLPSVTAVLSRVGLIDATWFTEGAATLGTYVHEATRLHDLGSLDESTVDERVRPYLEAWHKFRITVSAYIEPNWIERAVCDPVYGYAGTLDRIIRLSVEPDHWLIDIKTGEPDRWHQLQTAAYAACVPFAVRRATLYLRDDGNYRFKTHLDRRDIDVFRAALTVHNWRAAA